jgi:hypothetical protein
VKVAKLRHFAGIYLQVLKKTTKNGSHDFPGRDSNPAPAFSIEQVK